MRRRFFNNKKNIVENYLTFVALEDGLTINHNQVLEYCIDGDDNWKVLLPATNSESINSGQMLSVRANFINNQQGRMNSFFITKRCNLTGNCMSVILGDNAKLNKFEKYDLSYLFENCINIESVSSNFLPATTLIPDCYSHMFYGCTSLTTAPELPATTLKHSCYQNMFQGCTKLNYIKMLATDISANYCLSGWVYGVSSSGTFVKNPAMTSLPTGISGIPSGWTVVNDGEE